MMPSKPHVPTAIGQIGEQKPVLGSLVLGGNQDALEGQ